MPHKLTSIFLPYQPLSPFPMNIDGIGRRAENLLENSLEALF